MDLTENDTLSIVHKHGMYTVDDEDDLEYMWQDIKDDYCLVLDKFTVTGQV